jgi:hypothetical protein
MTVSTAWASMTDVTCRYPESRRRTCDDPVTFRHREDVADPLGLQVAA